MNMRNRQQSGVTRVPIQKLLDVYCVLVTTTLLPVSHLHYGDHCLFLMSITTTFLPISHLHYGECCLIYISLGPDNFNKTVVFRGEGGLK